MRLIHTILSSLTSPDFIFNLEQVIQYPNTRLPRIKEDINASLDHKAALCVKFIVSKGSETIRANPRKVHKIQMHILEFKLLILNVNTETLNQTHHSKNLRL